MLIGFRSTLAGREGWLLVVWMVRKQRAWADVRAYVFEPWVAHKTGGDEGVLLGSSDGIAVVVGGP
jgi:hypothetical protein